MTLPSNAISKKYYLVQLRFTKQVTYSLYSGNVYVFDAEYPAPLNIWSYATELTRVSSIPTNDREWFYDSSTRKIYFRDDDLSYPLLLISQLVLVQYAIYLTNDVNRILDIDPSNPNATYTEKVLWHGRLIENPVLSIDSSNIIDGVLSVSNFNISLNNHDGYFQEFVKLDSNFYGQDVNVWHSIDVDGEITTEKILKGRIIDISVGDKVSLSVDNIFSDFGKIFYGQSNPGQAKLDQNYFDIIHFPNVIPEKENTPIPSLYCRVTPSFYAEKYSIDASEGYYSDFLSGFIMGGNLGNGAYGLVYGMEAVNISWTGAESGTDNRTWGCFYKPVTTDGRHTENIGTVTSLGSSRYTITVADSSKFRYFDNVVISTSTALVYEIASSTLINVKMFSGTPSSGQLLTRYEISSVFLVDPKVNHSAGNSKWFQHLRFGFDYTLSTSDRLLRIVLVDDFETNYTFGAGTGIGISTGAKIYYRAWGRDGLTHTGLVDEIISDLGLSLDSSSLTQSSSTLINRLNFTIPFFGENQFPTYQAVLQKICSSTLSLLGIKNGDEISYITIPTTLTPTQYITEDKILMGSFSQSIDYKDLTDIINFKNKHGESLSSLDTNYIATEQRELEPTLGSAIINGGKSVERESILELTSTRNAFITDFLSQRRVTFTFETSGVNFNSEIGDVINVTHSKLIGNDSSKNMIIVGLEKSGSTTKVKAIEIYTVWGY